MTSALLSRLDLADERVRADCGEALRRARDLGGPAARADWVERWLPALGAWLIDCGGIQSDIEALKEQVSDLEQELEEAGGLSTSDLRALEKAIEQVREAFEAGASRSDILDLFDRLEGVVDDLPTED